jgi:hypothetical protein
MLFVRDYFLLRSYNLRIYRGKVLLDNRINLSSIIFLQFFSRVRILTANFCLKQSAFFPCMKISLTFSSVSARVCQNQTDAGSKDGIVCGIYDTQLV